MDNHQQVLTVMNTADKILWTQNTHLGEKIMIAKSKSNLNTGYILSIIISFLATVSSAGGLLLKGLYHDNNFVKSAWYTNDIITLIVVVPLLVVAMLLLKKGFNAG